MARSISVAAAAAVAAWVALAGCVSQSVLDIQGFQKAPLMGMVYDERNEPCTGARLIVDGKPGPRTDLAGRFMVPELTAGLHKVAVEKNGFERLEVAVDFYDKSQVLYLKVVSLQQIIARIEEALSGRKMADAEALLVRAEAVDAANTDVRYLRAVFLLRSDRPADAVSALEKLLNGGERAPAIYLTLADIYQYRLQNKGKARTALEGYLKVQEESEVRARLEALNKPGSP